MRHRLAIQFPRILEISSPPAHPIRGDTVRRDTKGRGNVESWIRLGTIACGADSAERRLFFGLAHGVLRNSQAAEDVCQQRLLKAWEHRHNLLDPESLRGWLVQGRRQRKPGNLPPRQAGCDSAANGNVAVPKDAQPPHHLVDLRESVNIALEKLPDHLREVVVLRLMEGLKGQDVARMLGITAVAVSRQLYQGIDRSREHLIDWQSAVGDVI